MSFVVVPVIRETLMVAECEPPATPRPPFYNSDGATGMHITRTYVPWWVCVAAIAIYLLHAANFLYFFVDDEGIPYVYAQNLLGGRGLTYNTVEPRVEGYSDFLHVGVSTLILALTKAAGLPKLSVFFAGKAVSMVAGAAVMWLVWLILRRLDAGRSAGIAALGLLALSGPFAVWSASSLETVPFTLSVVVLAWMLVWGRWRRAGVAASIVVLYRVDGFVFAGALVVTFLLLADTAERRAILRGVVLPALVVLAAYHAWRVSYFGALLPAPLHAKVLYKFTPAAGRLTKGPEISYWLRFLQMLGWPLAAALVIATAYAVRAGGVARRIALAAAVLFLYVAVVGDWMSGFRFFVPLMPLFAVMLALAVRGLASRQPRLVAAATLALLIWCVLDAVRFFHTYREQEHKDSFLFRPSADPARFFAPYYGLYRTAAGIIKPGEVVAYNQAGFVPFMLDLTNIDDLGICSRFFAELPVNDVFFTEVGRYAPLTNKRALRAHEAYLLYRNTRFIVARADLLRSANQATIPAHLMAGYYELIATDETGDNAIYRRTARPAARYQSSPDSFFENFAHVANLRYASINGNVIAPAEFAAQLPFLRDGGSSFDVNGELLIDLRFSKDEPMVDVLNIEELRVSEAATVKMTLWTAGGRQAHADVRQVPAGARLPVEVEIPGGVAASRFVLQIIPAKGASARVRIDDLRIQGQTAALSQYLARFMSTRPRVRSLRTRSPESLRYAAADDFGQGAVAAQRKVNPVAHEQRVVRSREAFELSGRIAEEASRFSSSPAGDLNVLLVHGNQVREPIEVPALQVRGFASGHMIRRSRDEDRRDARLARQR